MFRLLPCALLAAILQPSSGPVDSLSTLQGRIDAARAGDVIVVKNGTYTTTAPIVVKAQGTPGKPIRIAAESVGGVTLAGSAGFDLVAPAAHVEIDGFVFTH